MNRRRHLRFQDRISLLVIAAAAPAWLVATYLLWNWGASTTLRWALFVTITLFLGAGARAVRNRVVHPLQSLANVLEALREGDYSVRGRDADPGDAVGEVMIEVNLLSSSLCKQRVDTLEVGALLDKVIAEVDIAVFAFDAQRELRLVNRAGAVLLGRNALELAGCTAADLGLAAMLDGGSGRIVPHVFPGGAGRWEIRRRSFREGGRPHELLVISELSLALREEERQTWRRLVRVLGHELNSSLTPIKSMAATLRTLIGREPLPDDWRDDAQTSLAIIHDRAGSLARFMASYARLARLPPPTRRMVDFAAVVGRAASLYGERVEIEAHPEVQLQLDADQMEQVLINLIKNAIEAADPAGSVCVRWNTADGRLLVEIEDDGPGLAGTDNLWVPFFTTKRGGTGIGLVLSREIVENHGGTISLENRPGARGCIARVSLPLQGT